MSSLTSITPPIPEEITRSARWRRLWDRLLREPATSPAMRYQPQSQDTPAEDSANVREIGATRCPSDHR